MMDKECRKAGVFVYLMFAFLWFLFFSYFVNPFFLLYLPPYGLSILVGCLGIYIFGIFKKMTNYYNYLLLIFVVAVQIILYFRLSQFWYEKILDGDGQFYNNLSSTLVEIGTCFLSISFGAICVAKYVCRTRNNRIND